MKKNKKIFTIIALFVLIVAIGTTYYYASNRHEFTSETKNLKNYITQAQSETKLTNVKEEKYCSYGHHKYANGDLTCVTETTFVTDILLVDRISSLTRTLSWGGGDNNLSALIDNNDGRPIVSEIYKRGGLTCRYTVRVKGNNATYYVGCNGPAKAEWFPVKNS